MTAYSRRRLLPALAVFIGAMVMLPYAAHASKRVYFAGYMGLNIFPEQDFKDTSTNDTGLIGVDNTYSFAGAIGFKLTPQIRIEGELNYMNPELNTLQIDGTGAFDLGGDIETKMAMLNLYYDFDFSWRRVRPFVGAGVGYAWHDANIDNVGGVAQNISESSSGLVWQLGGGMRYPLGKDINLIGAYRYLDGQDIDLGPYEMDYGAHEFRVGISWDLPFE